MLHKFLTKRPSSTDAQRIDGQERVCQADDSRKISEIRCIQSRLPRPVRHRLIVAPVKKHHVASTPILAIRPTVDPLPTTSPRRWSTGPVVHAHLLRLL